MGAKLAQASRSSEPVALRVFISGPSGGLTPYQQAAVDVCYRLGLTPVYMEFDPQLTVAEMSRRAVESSDIFVLLLGHKYGARPPGSELSYSELEYQWAAERPEMPLLAFVADPTFPWPPRDIDVGADAEALARFVARVKARHVVMPLAEVSAFQENLLVALKRESDALSPAAQQQPVAFFSYARVDAPVVQLFADELRSKGVRVLLDVEFLQPGERWETAILDKVRSADALIFFVSRASLRSDWASAELAAFGTASRKGIFPVLINGTTFSDLPAPLAEYQAILVADNSAIPAAAVDLADGLTRNLTGDRGLSEEAERQGAQLAAGIAADIRDPNIDLDRASNSVFLVHGHDHGFRDEVDLFLRGFGIQPVILSKVGGGARSLLDKFETLATQAEFAVILMSADDRGASRLQYDDAKYGGDQTLKFRARENVILELGFFYGRLGWEKVFVVQKPAEHAWPDFERPSDLAGIAFFETTGESDWRIELVEALRKAGLPVSTPA